MAHLFEAPRWIAIEGPIRAGKSSLAHLLAETTGATRIVEPQENPFLDRFYRGEKGAAFAAQMWFLTARYQQMREAAEQDERSGGRTAVVSDYIFEKDKLFANLNLSDEELTLYNLQYQYFCRQLPTPDMVIYLQASSPVLRTRLKRKGLPGERAISDVYLEQVVRAYEHFFFHYTASDLLVVNTDDIDFVRNNDDLQLLLRRLSEPVKGTQYFLPLAQPSRRGPSGLLRGGLKPVSALRELAHGFAPGVAHVAQRLRRAL